MVNSESGLCHYYRVTSVLDAFVASWEKSLADAVELGEVWPGNQRTRELLCEFTPPSLGPDVLDQTQAWLVIDWLVRTTTPGFLRRAGFESQASDLEKLKEINHHRRASRALRPLGVAVMAAEGATAGIMGSLGGGTPVTAQSAARSARASSGVKACLDALVKDAPVSGYGDWGPDARRPRITGMPTEVDRVWHYVNRATYAAAIAVAWGAITDIPQPTGQPVYDASAEYWLGPPRAAEEAFRQKQESYLAAVQQRSREPLREGVDAVQRSALELLRRLSAVSPV